MIALDRLKIFRPATPTVSNRSKSQEKLSQQRTLTEGGLEFRAAN